MTAHEAHLSRDYSVTLIDLVAYAGATWDWHRMHYDVEWARAAGFPGPVLDGQQLGAWLAALVQEAAGPQWRLAEMAFRFAHTVHPGDTVRCTVRRTANNPGTLRYELSADVVGDDGEVRHPALTGASARLAPR
jgi:acyl dehydratase